MKINFDLFLIYMSKLLVNNYYWAYIYIYSNPSHYRPSDVRLLYMFGPWRLIRPIDE
jgi:hypothetical protein